MKESLILSAINDRHMVEIVYTDSKCSTSHRLTEPYEIKGDKYYGYCIQKNGIRAFKLSNISKLIVTDKTYVPRWTV